MHVGAKNLEKDLEVCTVRFLCNLKNFSELFTVINYLGMGGKSYSDKILLSENFTILFSKNNADGEIKLSDLGDFRNADKEKKLTRWEPIFSENDKSDDVAYFQYFLLILKYLAKEKYNYMVRISAGYDSKNCEYMTIQYNGKWSRLRTFLYLYSDEELSKILIYSKIKGKNGWRRIKDIDKVTKSVDFGKIFPLLPINAATYNALVNTSCEKIEQDAWQIKIYNLYDAYRDRVLVNSVLEYKEKSKKLKKQEERLKENWEKENDAANRGDWEKFEKLKQTNIGLRKEVDALSHKIAEERNHYFSHYKNDSLLEGLIFAATAFYLDDRDLLTESKRKKLTELHEICVDYAQGIAQLIENIIYHVIGEESKECGCGSFTFRVREREDAGFYIVKNAFSADIKKFMEIYVADYNYDNFGGFVNKFCENVENRFSGDKAELQKLANKKNTIGLPNFFGENLGPDRYMTEYYEDSKNIALHYGLQIFNNVVKTNDGCLYMTSGAWDDSGITDTNKFFSEDYVDMDKRYKDPELFWRNGTAYIVYLPIKFKTQEINYTDAVAESNIDISANNSRELLLLLPLDKRYALTAVGKKDCVEDICKIIKKIKADSWDGIYFIDFKKFYEEIIKVGIPFNKFEILAKALFLLFAETFDFKDIAIVNLGEEYDVVRMFRQFALFYNRAGNCRNMDKRSVFLVDDLGQFDILIYGKNLNTIEQNLAYGQIYGGYSDTAMTIINHISRGKDDK